MFGHVIRPSLSPKRLDFHNSDMGTTCQELSPRRDDRVLKAVDLEMGRGAGLVKWAFEKIYCTEEKPYWPCSSSRELSRKESV